jgi:hypothetical protein
VFIKVEYSDLSSLEIVEYSDLSSLEIASAQYKKCNLCFSMFRYVIEC